jgi:hypothetical protein
MKMFSDCSGECCVCACNKGCLAGHGDDYFYAATIEQVIERLDKGQYPYHRQYMIDWLRRKGYEYKR